MLFESGSLAISYNMKEKYFVVEVEPNAFTALSKGVKTTMSKTR